MLKKVSNPSCVLLLSFLAADGSDILRMSQCDTADIFQYIIHWYPVLAGRFHADMSA